MPRWTRLCLKRRDLEVIKEFLNREARGRKVESSRVLKPTVLRCLTGSFPDDVTGRTFQEVHRKGKVLLMELSGDRWLAVNPMLTGALQLCEPGQRVLKKTCLAIALTGDRIGTQVSGRPADGQGLLL